MTFDRRFSAALPFGACVGVALPAIAPGEGDWPPALNEDERAFAHTLGDARRASWIGGRVALHAALDAAGLSFDGAILATSRGAPQLPPGASGSISHKGQLAVALAAPAGEPTTTVGIDMEQLRPLRSDIATHVLTARERATLPPPGPARYASVLRRFCAKEAIYKALHPWLARYVAFSEAEIAFDGPQVTAHLHLARGEGPFSIELSDAGDLAGRGYVLMTARARRA